MAAAISCMRGLPAGCARIQRTEMRPKRIATTPAAIASHSALSRVMKHSPFGSYVIEKYEFIVLKSDATISQKGCAGASPRWRLLESRNWADRCDREDSLRRQSGAIDTACRSR